MLVLESRHRHGRARRGPRRPHRLPRRRARRDVGRAGQARDGDAAGRVGRPGEGGRRPAGLPAGAAGRRAGRAADDRLAAGRPDPVPRRRQDPAGRRRRATSAWSAQILDTLVHHQGPVARPGSARDPEGTTTTSQAIPGQARRSSPSRRHPVPLRRPASVSSTTCGGTGPVWRPGLKTWVRPSRRLPGAAVHPRRLVDVPAQHQVRLVLRDPAGQVVVGELTPAVAAQHRAGRRRVVDPDPTLRPVDRGGGELGLDGVPADAARPTTGTR